MTLEDKTVEAKGLIIQSLERSANPVILSSFGKDSMVLLELFKQLEIKLPILFFREHHFPKKYQFANKIIEDNEYEVYDYPPLYSALSKHEGHVEIANFYQVGTEDQNVFCPTGVRDPLPGEPFLCGLRDIYDKPKGTYEFRWDTVYIGHKSSDHDPILGDVPVNSDLTDTGPFILVFPLRHFTDKDVWEFHKKFNVPINMKRYNEQDGWREFTDLTYNPDCFPACIACIDRDRESEVLCPKAGTKIPNISAGIKYIQLVVPEYMRR